MPGLVVHFRRATALLKGDPAHLRLPWVRSRVGEGGGRPRIRCPRCAWEPGRDDRWACRCDFSWNTFDTGGVCPACDHRWLDTMCLLCHQWSKHADWYADGDDSDNGSSGTGSSS